ncbi:prenylcysteine oxidase 1-like [Anolis carolinensis]|uniref:prenylcysteine oxidase 1-like n=1 Tax=Anolis carolinensis TaxID=28377 RepID=UPI002F2B2390
MSQCSPLVPKQGGGGGRHPGLSQCARSVCLERLLGRVPAWLPWPACLPSFLRPFLALDPPDRPGRSQPGPSSLASQALWFPVLPVLPSLAMAWPGSASLLGTFFLLSSSSLLLLQTSATTPLRRPPARIGVIGAGIGGSSAAYFLRQKFGKDVPIDVFERGQVGGRLATIDLEGKGYEAGGTVIHPLNLHMKHFVKELGLSVVQGHGGLLGIYNGEELVFEESGWTIWNFLKLLWRYGLNAIRKSMWVEETLDKFMRVYRYQAHGYAFSSNVALLHALGGAELVQTWNQTMEESMRKAGFSQTFIHEMAAPIMRYNYGQGVGINGFVGVVAFTGVDKGLWSVEGGNQRVCSGLLQASKTHLIPGTVTSVEETTRPRGRSGETVKLYEVTYESTSGVTSSSLYDIVVIAAPLHREMANISFRNFHPPVPEFSKPYEHVVSTFVHGNINSSLFGYPDPSQLQLNDIFTTEDPKAFVYSISIVPPVDNDADAVASTPVWKMFSARPLTKAQLDVLFSSYDSVESKAWLAYPHYSPPEQCPPLVIHDHVYYVNSMEWVASAMEMGAISAKNIALLAHHRWYERTDKIDQEDLHEKLKTEL